MDKPRKNNVYNFVGAFSDISVNDSLISSNALQHKSAISSFPFKCEDEQESDKMRKEINGIGGSYVEVHDVRIQSNNWCSCSVSEEVKVTNCYSERVCVIKQENPGNDSEQDPLFINEDDLSRKIILERNDSTSPFFSKIKKEKPDNDLNQDPLLLTEQDYINFAKNVGKDMKIEEDDVNKTTLHLKDLRVVLERIDINVLLPSLIEEENTDVLAASAVNGNEKERSLAKETSFPSTKEQSRDVVNILEKKVKESAHNVDSTILFHKDVINPQFSKNECQGKSLEQSIVCGNCQRIKHYSHVPYTLEAQNNNVNKKCECRSNDKGNQKIEVTSFTKIMEPITHPGTDVEDYGSVESNMYSEWSFGARTNSYSDFIFGDSDFDLSNEEATSSSSSGLELPPSGLQPTQPPRLRRRTVRYVLHRANRRHRRLLEFQGICGPVSMRKPMEIRIFSDHDEKLAKRFEKYVVKHKRAAIMGRLNRM